MAANTDSFKYWAPVDRTAPNNAHAFSLAMIGRDKDVLELGCAAGHVTQALVEQGCRVVGIEYDARAAEAAAEIADDVVVTSLFDPGAVTKAVAGREFDVVYAGDVLEHLIDPAGVLQECREALRPGGYAVISLPNVAHVDVKLALLAGRFEYRDYGLLDRTHLRFFTRASITQLVEDAGFHLVELHRVMRPPFETELEVNASDVPSEILRAALEDPEAQSYQFVLRAVPVDGTAEQEAQVRRFADIDEQLRQERSQRATLEVDFATLEEKVAAMEAQLSDAVQARQELDAVYRTKTFRATAGLRSLYRALRSAR
ncbi:MAG: class I SAM-dependent methyltransferase [Acidimicrobiales bacterium]|nr:class I SAM-dependent methyltransferase [Acidimicrobiales bacterium]